MTNERPAFLGTGRGRGATTINWCGGNLDWRAVAHVRIAERIGTFVNPCSARRQSKGGAYGLLVATVEG